MGSDFIPEENFRDNEDYLAFAENYPILVEEFSVDENNPLRQGLIDIINNNDLYRSFFEEHKSERNTIKGNHSWNDFYNFIFNLWPQELVRVINENNFRHDYEGNAITLPFGNYPHICWVGVNSFDGVYPVYLFKGNSGVYLTLCLSTENLYSGRNPTPKDLRKIRVFRNIFENIFLKHYENESNLGFKIHEFFDSVDLSKNEYENDDEKKTHRKKAKPYEIGTIFAKYYDINNLPRERKLTTDFLQCVKMYEFAKKHHIYEKVEDILYSDQDFYSIDTRTYDFTHRESDRLNELYYGVPGSGKSRFIKDNVLQDADESRIERVLFHPDYTYSDFIGQILPLVSGGEVRYEFVPGPFTSILKKAYSDPENKYYLLIEEINRGNAPAIFGDVFQLLDRKIEIGTIDSQTEDEPIDNNGLEEILDGDEDSENHDEEENEESIGTVQNGGRNEYPAGTSEYGINNSNIASIVYGKDNKDHMVRIPSNLSIIASMNTSDQNVFTLDTAFQRRWGMKLIPNSFEGVRDSLKSAQIYNSGCTWENFCTRINEIILNNNSLNLSSEDKRLGVYFVNENEINDPELFSEKVLKYLWDDAFKFNRDKIFKKEYDSLEKVISDFKDENLNCFDVFKEGIFDTIITLETDSNQEEE